MLRTATRCSSTRPTFLSKRHLFLARSGIVPRPGAGSARRSAERTVGRESGGQGIRGQETEKQQRPETLGLGHCLFLFSVFLTDFCLLSPAHVMSPELQAVVILGLVAGFGLPGEAFAVHFWLTRSVWRFRVWQCQSKCRGRVSSTQRFHFRFRFHSTPSRTIRSAIASRRNRFPIRTAATLLVNDDVVLIAVVGGCGAGIAAVRFFGQVDGGDIGVEIGFHFFANGFFRRRPGWG